MRNDVSSTTTSLLALIARAGACVACVLALGAMPANVVAATGGADADAGATQSGTSTPQSSTTTGGATAGSHARNRTSIATWFGPGMYGQKTACGQTLTPAVVGVANRTLPCGTLVQISYHDHAIVVPVLDRGPYAHGADWDLTAGAAQALGVTETVRIATRVVGSTANTPTLGSPPVTPAESATGGAQASG